MQSVNIFKIIVKRRPSIYMACSPEVGCRTKEKGKG